MSAAALDDLIGLASAKRVVRRLADPNSGVQSVLIYGPDGAGKSSLAKILVESWIRKQPPGEDDRAVSAYARGNCPDVLTIAPSGPQNLIKLAAIHQEKVDKEEQVPLRDFVRTMPLMANRKVVIMHDCHRMNDAASNALLKTLEEPLPHVKMILLTSEIGSVLQTIRSRCLCIACELPPSEDLLKVVNDPNVAELRLAHGAPGQLVHLREIEMTVCGIARLADELQVAHQPAALIFSDRFKAIADGFASEKKMNARTAQATCLEMLGAYLTREAEVHPEWVQHIAEAHRRIIGNGSASIVLDAMFCRILLGR